MTKRIKGWIIERPGKSFMEVEYVQGKKDPLYCYRLYVSKDEARIINAGHEEENIKEAMLIYKE